MGENRLQLSAGFVSVSTALVLVALKSYVALDSNSVGVLASALDSAFDVFSSVIILLAIIAAGKPADHDHRYGHGKAEALSGFVQSIVIVFSGLYIIYQAVMRFLEPRELERIPESLLVMAFATIATFFLITYQDYVARKTGSIAVKADRTHYLTDLLANMVVITSLILEKFFQMRLADLIAGALISLYIIKSALEIFKESFDILMDKDLSHLYTDYLEEFVHKNSPDVLGYHNLRSRSAGNCVFLEFHLEMNKSLTFEKSHHLVEHLIAELRARNKKLEVTIHSDPAELDEKSGKVRLLDDDHPTLF